MKVYTVIVTYNGIKWIDLCLKNIVNQSEVIIIDNNSTDGTVDYVSNNYPMVTVVPQNINWGFGGANNLGISMAIKNGADAVFLLNQDAYAKPNCVKNLIKTYSQNKEYGIVSPIHFNGNGDALDYSFQKVSYMSPLISDLITGNYKEIYDYKFVNAAAWFISKDVFYKVGGFDPLFFMYGEDDNYIQRVIFHGFKIGVVPNATIYHDTGNNNYEQGVVGSDKYYRQFVNSVLVKYANINTNNYKLVGRFKLYLLKKALLCLLTLQLKKGLTYIQKLKRIDVKGIKNSVLNNKIEKANYLSI